MKCLSSPNALVPHKSAAAEMPGDGWSSKPTLFHWQSMSPHADLHQQLRSLEMGMRTSK